MIVSFRKLRWSRIVLGAVAGMAILIGSAQFGVSHANEDEDNDLPDVKLFRNIMKGLGLRRDGEAGIEYRERSPLVLPPSSDLPSPERGKNPQSTAAWPKDPDVERAKKARTERRASNPDPDDLSRPLSPGELAVRGAPRRGRDTVVRPGPTAEDASRPSSAEELGAKSVFSFVGKPKEEYTTFTREPARSSLTEPPPGYRTPSPAQPYGLGPQKWTPQAERDIHIPHR